MFPKPPAAASPCPSAADINAQIRALCAGRVVWTVAARAELARLTGEWREAVAREQGMAA
ncbi:hypothetical protein RVR_8378 [Actinacidiphila reveromycinica]|uniref:Uncharacterized protein n=1 Tax=Actinacidiphila reveromycinica TaxID=659352 RepID=A0A7U3VRS7_9ACTN|nr:hypothetical protein [Streptomyces sp. SN-593]BBB01121.1 hypothetical protein RVR_8378 [Streptomyces sp. SN-593]